MIFLLIIFCASVIAAACAIAAFWPDTYDRLFGKVPAVPGNPGSRQTRRVIGSVILGFALFAILKLLMVAVRCGCIPEGR
jgi:hypothetical protein